MRERKKEKREGREKGEREKGERERRERERERIIPAISWSNRRPTQSRESEWERGWERDAHGERWTQGERERTTSATSGPIRGLPSLSR